MGYDVHITRGSDLNDAESSPVTLEEWLAYVASDAQMRLDNFAEALVGSDVLRYENDGLAVWTTYSGHRDGGGMVWFDYRHGRVVVKNPDEEILGKMCQIARALGARVVGDEGEEY